MIGSSNIDTSQDRWFLWHWFCLRPVLWKSC